MNQDSISNECLREIIKVQTEVVQQGLDLCRIMDLVTERTQQIVGADGASIELIEENELVYSSGYGMAEKFLGLRLQIENSLSGECIKLRKSLICYDAETDARVNKQACQQIGIKSMIVTPLICEDHVVGVMKVFSKATDYFIDDQIYIFELLSDLIAAAMFNAIRNGESELFYKATHDSLTGISNRSIFYDRLRQMINSALRNHEKFGVVTLDLDGLKEINDSLGHRTGDAAIKETASRICRTIREVDTVSRLGGDEFGIIVPLISNRSDLNVLLERIDEEIDKAFFFEGHEIKLSISMGYAIFQEDGVDLELLIETADRAMYETKRGKKGQIR